MKKKTAQPDHDKSLKTFYFYAVGVFVLIAISLAIRGFVLFQQNVFDPARHFTLIVAQKGIVKKIISFNPQIPAVSILNITDNNVQSSSLAKNYGITFDGTMQLDDTPAMTSDLTALMWYAVIHDATLQSNMTIFDTIRLFLLSKNIATNNEITTDVRLSDQTNRTNTEVTQALTDPDIASEGVSIQIINATDITGMGQRLSKVLTNMGANVVDVSSAQDTQKQTTIAYFGGESLTLDHLQKLLQTTPQKVTTQPIANIVITIGTDKSNTTTF